MRALESKRKIQTRISPFLNNEKRLVRLYRFDGEFSSIITEDCQVNDFHWIQSQKGIYIGSNGPDALARRRPHRNIKVKLSNLICDDVYDWAAEVGSEVEITFLDCFFRGNWKLDQSEIGQNHLIKVSGGNVLFERCSFWNSRAPILIKANSQVIVKGCSFSSCENAVEIDGFDNPRSNDTYYNGKGKSHVKILDCQTRKVVTLVKCFTGGTAEIKNTPNEDGQLFIRDGGECIV